MAATMGPAPWSTGYKKLTTVTAKKLGKAGELAWGQYKDDWKKVPKRGNVKTIHLANGRVVQIPEADYKYFIGHHVSPESDPDSEIGKYIEKAWESNKVEVDGVGHIDDMIYAPMYQLLWVGFITDGSVVVFFRVPKELFVELQHLAESGAKQISSVDGTERHVLGIRFWDLIRIRGQREGSRYRYEYTIKGTGTGTEFTRSVANIEPEVKVAEPTIELYKGYARNFLTGQKLTEFNKLKTEKEMAQFLRKAGII